MKPILCTSDLRNIHVCFATESSTKCFEHLRSPLKNKRAWLRCKKIENCKVKLEYWNLHPTELLKVEWLLAKMLAIKNARDHFASKIRANLDHGASKMRADHWSRSRSARAMLAINVHMILSPTVRVTLQLLCYFVIIYRLWQFCRWMCTSLFWFEGKCSIRKAITRAGKFLGDLYYLL